MQISNKVHLDLVFGDCLALIGCQCAMILVDFTTCYTYVFVLSSLMSSNIISSFQSLQSAPVVSLRNSTLILTRTNCGCYCPVDHFKQKQNNNRSAPSVLQWSWWENLVNNWARYLSPAYLKHILVMSCGSIPFVMQHNAQWITQPTWPSTHLNFWTCSQQQTGCLVMAPTFLNEVLSHTMQEQWICIYNSGT